MPNMLQFGICRKKIYCIAFAKVRAARSALAVSCLCHAIWDGAHLKPLDFKSVLVCSSGFPSKRNCSRIISVFLTIRKPSPLISSVCSVGGFSPFQSLQPVRIAFKVLTVVWQFPRRMECRLSPPAGFCVGLLHLILQGCQLLDLCAELVGGVDVPRLDWSALTLVSKIFDAFFKRPCSRAYVNYIFAVWGNQCQQLKRKISI